MELQNSLYPRRLALFEKRYEGDDALLRLASLRFKEAGMGTEYHAGTTAHLDWLLRFKPTEEAPATVHLPREIDLMKADNRQLVISFADSFKDRIHGMVVHDQKEAYIRSDAYLLAVAELGTVLGSIKGSPKLFIEYASGLDPELYIGLFRNLRNVQSISACVDIGHIGLWQVQSTYSKRRPTKNIFAVDPYHSSFPDLVDDVQVSVTSALQMVLDVVKELGELQKPVHFHLHDGHPLSNSSPFGISDHLSFFTEIAIPIEYDEKHSLSTMFGPSGLSKIISESLAAVGPHLVSYSLEIHPAEGRLCLGQATHLFGHWRDLANAEKMNYWLSVLAQNHLLLSEVCRHYVSGAGQ